MTFNVHEKAKFGHDQYSLLLASACLLDVVAVRQLSEGAGWGAIAPLPGLALATLGLAILSVKSWRARLHGDVRLHTKTPVRYHAAACVLMALAVGFVVTPILEPFVSEQSMAWILLAAVIIGGALLTGSLFMSRGAEGMQRGGDTPGHWLGYPAITFLALTAAGVCRIGYDGTLSVHAVQAALAFALLVMAGLAAALLDGRIPLHQ